MSDAPIRTTPPAIAAPAAAAAAPRTRQKLNSRANGERLFKV